MSGRDRPTARIVRQLAAALFAGASLAAQNRPASSRPGDWPTYGNDAGGLKYSPLADIDRTNVGRLEVAFTWSPNEQPIPASPGQQAARPGLFQVTPLAIGDTLFLSTSYNRVVALDGGTGRELWAFDPQAWKVHGQPNVGTGFVHRGVATWTDGRERRIFLNTRWRLIALNAATGTPVPGFGTNGEVDVTRALSRPVTRREHFAASSPPVVWGDLVIVGSAVGDRLVYRDDPPGDVQAFDARTGQRVWRFNTVPQAGEVGNDTWKRESWKHTGHTNVWAPFTVDSARGLVYLPVGTPSNDWYGGARPGDNLFAESIVCLDARTGKRVWHFQVAHHGLWDYDLPAPPTLVTVTHDGRRVDAVAVATKQGFMFVFDRVTGKPLWPIDERPVPRSTVPGEVAAATQPFPTKPAPFAKQGFSVDDVIDYTPELKAAALAEIATFRLGPLYTPPSREGTVVMPGAIGGAGWGGAAADPTTGWVYVKATNSPVVWSVDRYATPNDTIDAPYMVNLSQPSLGVALRDGPEGTERRAGRLPINKPPYGTLTAIDLNTGDTKWQVPVGDAPEMRARLTALGVSLPDKLGVGGAPGPIVTAGGLVFLTGGGRVLYAFDARTGATLWEHDLGQQGYAVPMTYRTRAGKQYVVIATGTGATAKLVAFALRDG